MLTWAIAFCVIALLAAALGMGGVEGLALQIAKVLFVVALVILIVRLVAPGAA